MFLFQTCNVHRIIRSQLFAIAKFEIIGFYWWKFTFSFTRSSCRTSVISFLQPSCIAWNDSFGCSPKPDTAIASKSCKIFANDGRLWGSIAQQPCIIEINSCIFVCLQHNQSHICVTLFTTRSKNNKSIAIVTYFPLIFPSFLDMFLVLVALMRMLQYHMRYSYIRNRGMESRPLAAPMITHHSSKHRTL